MFFENEQPYVSGPSVYYPFGMGMPGRKFDAGSGYRYGFNGKDKTNEVYGEANAYDYGNRIYNPRIGRWFKPDVLEARLPMMSTYHFGLNNPLRYSDHQGDFIIDEATAKAYPKLKPLLNALLIELQKPENEKKVAELVRLGQFKDRQAFFDVLTDGKGPKLSVQNIVTVDKKVTTSTRYVDVPNPLGSGTISQPQTTTLSEYSISLTDVGKLLMKNNPGETPSAVTVTTGGGSTEETIEKRGKSKVTITSPEPFSQEVVLDDDLGNVTNNDKASLNKDGTVNMKKASNSLTYFLKVIIHEIGHVGDQQALVPGAAKPGSEIGKASEDSYYSEKKQKDINDSEVLFENKKKE